MIADDGKPGLYLRPSCATCKHWNTAITRQSPFRAHAFPNAKHPTEEVIGFFTAADADAAFKLARARWPHGKLTIDPREHRQYATCLRIGTGAGWPESDTAPRFENIATGAPLVFGAAGPAYVGTPGDFSCSLWEAQAPR